MNYLDSLESYENWVLDAPDYFTVFVYRGPFFRDRRVAKTLGSARSIAKRMKRKRPALIYAVRETHDVAFELIK